MTDPDLTTAAAVESAADTEPTADELNAAVAAAGQVHPKPRRRIRPLTADAQAWQAERAEFSARLAALSIAATRARRQLWLALPLVGVAGVLIGWAL